MLCEKYGGRVELAKAYFKALTASVRKHFNGNGVIASMEHCNDFMFLGTEAICLGRVGMSLQSFFFFFFYFTFN
jgi:raffinose synthase